MTEPSTGSWGTSSWGASADATDETVTMPAVPAAEPGRHAQLPDPQPAQQQTSYGTMFEHPPYATEEAPMTVDVPEQAPPRPSPYPAADAGPTAGESPAAPSVPAASPSYASTGYATESAPAPVAPPPSGSGSSETVTCPECGASQFVNLNRRDATDFCRRCDFPLFWTPSRVSREWNTSRNGESLRRLPGTGGATRLASLACPHCAERNPATAELCARCGRSMHLEPPPPMPVPVYVPPPAPAPEPEPKAGIPYWVWVIAGAAAAGIAFLVLFLVGVISF